MNEPSQESNCIVIDAPSPLYSLSVKDEELIETFSKRNFNDYKRLWSDIASNKLTGNNGEKLSSIPFIILVMIYLYLISLIY